MPCGRKKRKATGFQHSFGFSPKVQGSIDRYEREKKNGAYDGRLPNETVNELTNSTSQSVAYEYHARTSHSPGKEKCDHLIHEQDNRLLDYLTLKHGIIDQLQCIKCNEMRVQDELHGFGMFIKQNVHHMEHSTMMELVLLYQRRQKNKDLPISINEETIGISTTLSCRCPIHQVLFETANIRTKLGKPAKKSAHSYLNNVALTLSTQSFGGGGAEAERIIRFLGLPHASSFGSNNFRQIENELHPIIQEITQDSLAKALEEEVLEELRTQGEEDQLDSWKEGKCVVGIHVSYDMGWQKRASGHKYDSSSGHGLVVGKHTSKILDYVVKVKNCRICNKHVKADNVPNHDCVKNHHGSSKSMEVDGILEMVIRLHDEKNVRINSITADDDTTMIAHLTHPLISNNGKQTNKGRLPTHIPIPIHQADPSHRKKVIGTHLYALATAPKKVSTVQKSDVEKILRNWGYMLSSIKHLDPKQDMGMVKKKAKAVLDHHFNIHKNCDVNWCYSLQAKQKGLTYHHKHLSKKHHAEEYTQLEIALYPFSTEYMLRESMHTMNTPKNEAMNTSIARLCPKFKHLSNTVSLPTRIAVAIGISNLGYHVFYHTLLQQISSQEMSVPNIQRLEMKKYRESTRKSTPV